MKNFLLILERAWLVAAVCSLVFAAYNLITKHAFDHYVYFPVFCAGFCVLIWRNIGGQRKFLEKMKAKEEVKSEK